MGPEQRSDAETRVHGALLADASRYRSGLTTGEVRALLERRDVLATVGRWRLVMLPMALTILLAAVAIARIPAREAATGAGQSATPAAPSAAAAAGSGTGRLLVPGPIDLAACDIAPPDAGLAFAGWATRDVLGVTGGTAEPGQPVYALITSGMAEWVGWQADGTGPMFPPPIGRMGCLYEPVSGTTSLVGVPMDWQPPALVDGCLASETDSYGGYREVGGPNAWLVLPTDGSAWHAGSSALMLFRLAHSTGPDARLGGWAQAVGPDRRQVAGAGGGSTAAVRVTGSTATYFALRFRFPHPGCWVVNVTLEGSVVGSAVVAVLPATG